MDAKEAVTEPTQSKAGREGHGGKEAACLRILPNSEKMYRCGFPPRGGKDREVKRQARNSKAPCEQRGLRSRALRSGSGARTLVQVASPCTPQSLRTTQCNRFASSFLPASPNRTLPPPSGAFSGTKQVQRRRRGPTMVTSSRPRRARALRTWETSPTAAPAADSRTPGQTRGIAETWADPTGKGGASTFL